MKRMIKVTISDFTKIEQNLNDPAELALYQQVNGQVFEAEIEHDGYAVIDLPDDQYIELAPDEYTIMIAEWRVAGTFNQLTIETKSDEQNDQALLYRLVDQDGKEVEPPVSLPKAVVQQVAKTWFGGKPQSEPK